MIALAMLSFGAIADDVEETILDENKSKEEQEDCESCTI